MKVSSVDGRSVDDGFSRPSVSFSPQPFGERGAREEGGMRSGVVGRQNLNDANRLVVVEVTGAAGSSCSSRFTSWLVVVVVDGEFP